MPRSLDRTLRAARRPRRAEGRRKASAATSRPAGAPLDYDAVVDIAIKTFWSLHPSAALPAWFDRCALLDARPDAFGRWLVEVSLRRRKAAPMLVFRVTVAPDGAADVLLDVDPASLHGKDFAPVPPP